MYLHGCGSMKKNKHMGIIKKNDEKNKFKFLKIHLQN